MKPPELTFTLERIGDFKNSYLVREILKPYLFHESAVIREGTIYGLQDHVDEEVAGILTELSQKDPSSGVRTSAEDVLTEYREEEEEKRLRVEEISKIIRQEACDSLTII